MPSRLEIDVHICPLCNLVDLEPFECDGEEEAHESVEAVKRHLVEASPVEAVVCCGGPVGSNTTGVRCGVCGRNLEEKQPLQEGSK